MEPRNPRSNKRFRKRTLPYNIPKPELRNTNRLFRIKTASGEGKNEAAQGGHSETESKCRKCICNPADYSPVEFPAIWDELRKAKLLCDGIVRSNDGQAFNVHRAILSASSPYFRALFVNSLRKGGEQERTDVSLDISSNVLQLLLDYVYTGRCDVTHSNVQWLLPAADSYEILGVVELCCRYLLHEMRPENCLGIYKFSSHYFCHELAKKGRRYILHNFEDIILNSPEFIELSFEDLQALLLDDELNVRHEEHVFQAVISWINADPENRLEHLQGLLSCIRFVLMPMRYFKESVLQHHYISSNPQIQQFLYPTSLICAEYDNNEDQPLDTSQLISRPRVPYEVLFAIGGWSAGSPTNFVETFDTRAERWYLSVEMDMTPRAYHGVCALDGLIYMIGGFDGSEHFNTMRSYDPTKGIWSERACMYQARCYVSVCVLGGMVYALGGYNGRARMSSAERYCPKNNQWEMIQSMHKHRSDASAAALNDKVYIAGGFNGQDILNTAEVYDPSTNQWTFISVMNTARSGVSLVSFRGCLYALGGFNGYSRLASAERWDPNHSHQWSAINDMFSPRSNFAAVVIDDMIIAIGGFNGSSTIASVECYDGDSEEWFDTSPMNLNRSALSACVLAGLPNARDFSFISKVHSGIGSGSNENRENYENQQEEQEQEQLMLIDSGDAGETGT